MSLPPDVSLHTQAVTCKFDLLGLRHEYLSRSEEAGMLLEAFDSDFAAFETPPRQRGFRVSGKNLARNSKLVKPVKPATRSAG